ncbi:MAG: cell division protein ZipA [Pseudomonadota bacterium]
MPELTLRDGMVIVGSLLILAVAIDAWRRMRQQQRSRVRVRLATDLPGDDPQDDIAQYRELPNGGARVVRRDGSMPESRESSESNIRDRNAGAGPKNSAQAAGSDTAAASRSDAKAGGSLSASSDAATAKPASTAQAATRGGSSEAARPAAKPTAAAALAEATVEAEAVEESADEAVDGATTEDDFDEVAPLAGVSARDDEPANLDWLEDLPAHEPAPEDEAGELPRQTDTEVIILHVMARDESGFGGQDILEILLACDLRFGDMNFFHRHEQQAGRGPIQFSVANMLKPGVFDIDKMDEMRTRGLVFFLTLPGPEDMILAFDCMLETARAVARNLGGELLDESRSVLTQQAVEHSRQQIRELDRRLRAREL